MKKLILTFALSVALVSFSKAQFFITSFGVELGWNIPNRIHTVVHHDYYGYDVIHANRVIRYGRSYFDLILQRGDVFIDVTIRNDGFITRRVVSYDYPLFGHVCGATCGYHSNYYVAYYNNCNSHYHHGHNHVVYNYNRPYVGHRNFNNGRKYAHNRVQNNRSQVRHENNHVQRRSAAENTKRQTGSRVSSGENSRKSAEPTYKRRSTNHDTQTSKSSRSSRSTDSKTSRSRGGK